MLAHTDNRTKGSFCSKSYPANNFNFTEAFKIIQLYNPRYLRFVGVTTGLSRPCYFKKERV